MKQSSGLLGFVLAAAAFGGCTPSEDEKIAARACREYGAESRECKYVARRVKDEAEVKVSFGQQREAWRIEAEAAANAEALAAKMAAEGMDPCEELAARIRSEATFPVCDAGMAAAREFVQQDGCGAWMNADGTLRAGTLDEVSPFFEECAGGE
jgi:hypothetical protein